MEVEPAGPIITSIRNRAGAGARPERWWAACACLLIPLSIGLYFRRLRAVLFVSAPGVLATVLAYAVAYLAFGYLTTATSFLVAFVMGNGTNYAIVLLSRYEELSPAGTAGRPTPPWRLVGACGGPPAWRRWPRRSATCR